MGWTGKSTRSLFGAALFASLPCAIAADEAISLDEWLTLTLGKTVHYAVGGEPTGREYYPADGGFAVFEAPDGACVEGPWAHDEGRFCFWYGAQFQCFHHLRRGGEIISRSDTGGDEQVVTHIADDEPIYCAPG